MMFIFLFLLQGIIITLTIRKSLQMGLQMKYKSEKNKIKTTG